MNKQEQVQQMTTYMANFVSHIAKVLPDDIIAKLDELGAQEDAPLSKVIYETMKRNQKLAKELNRPSCQDTGVLQFWVKCGVDFPLIGEVEGLLKEAVVKSTFEAPLRHNSVETFDEFNTGRNVGKGTPTVWWDIIPNSDKCEIYAYNADADRLWEALWKAGEEYGLKNIGLGARDTLRLEKGFCLYGNDIDDTTSPLEAGLGWITKFAEGKEFIDRDRMERLKAEGVKRKLVGFKLIDRGIPRHGYPLKTVEGAEIGLVTSGTMSPSLKVGIGLGYVAAEHAAPGTVIAVEVRGRLLKAEVVKYPFV